MSLLRPLSKSHSLPPHARLTPEPRLPSEPIQRSHTPPLPQDKLSPRLSRKEQDKTSPRLSRKEQDKNSPRTIRKEQTLKKGKFGSPRMNRRDTFTGTKMTVTKSAAERSRNVSDDAFQLPPCSASETVEVDEQPCVVELGTVTVSLELIERSRSMRSTTGKFGSTDLLTNAATSNVFLHVTIVRADGLEPSHHNTETEPYIMASLLKSKRSKQKTASVPDSLNPVFNEELSWKLSSKEDADDMLCVEVWDMGRGNDILGIVHIPVLQVLESDTDTITARLHDAETAVRESTWSVENDEALDAKSIASQTSDISTAAASPLLPCIVTHMFNQSTKRSMVVTMLTHLRRKFSQATLKAKAIAALAITVALSCTVLFVMYFGVMLRWSLKTMALYPFLGLFSIFWYLPIVMFLPRLLGKLMSYIITDVVLHGYGTTFGEFHVFAPWVGMDKKLHLRVAVHELGFANPSNFVQPHFVKVRYVWIEFAASWSTILGLLNAFNTNWSPFPSICWKSTNGGDSKKYFGAVDVIGECDGLVINFETNDEKFNINEMSRELAEGEVKPFIGKNQQPPNLLKLKIKCARGLIEKRGKMPDARVCVEIRNQKYKTRNIPMQSSPLWNESFEIPVTDPSSVMMVKVKNGSQVIGIWLITLKWLIIDGARYPFCRYNILEESDVKKGKLAGWFPLVSSKFQNEGALGEIHLDMSWEYDIDAVAPPVKSQSALNQLTMNSDESQARLGNLDEVRNMLDCFPVLLNCSRITFRNVDFYLKDLFMGKAGQAEVKDKLKSIVVKRIDATDCFRPLPDADGLSLWGFLWQFWVHGVAPEVMKHKFALTGRATGQIFSGIFSSAFRDMKGLFSSSRNKTDENDKDKDGTLKKHKKKVFTKVHQRRNVEAIQSKTVTAFDTDYTLESTFSGLLEKSYRIGGVRYWNLYFCQLKGATLFYIQVDRTTHEDVNATRKINLRNAVEIRSVEKYIKLRWMSSSHKQVVGSCRLRVPKTKTKEPIQYLMDDTVVPKSLEEWSEKLNEHADLPSSPDMLSFRVLDVSQLSNAAVAIVRCTTDRWTDTAAPVEIKLKNHHHPMLLGPYNEETVWVRFDIYSAHAITGALTLIGSTCVPFDEITDNEYPRNRRVDAPGFEAKPEADVIAIGMAHFILYKVRSEDTNDSKEDETPRLSLLSANLSSLGSSGSLLIPKLAVYESGLVANSFGVHKIDRKKSSKKQLKVLNMTKSDWGSIAIKMTTNSVELTINVLSATDLIAVDRAGASDPFVTAHLLSDESATNMQRTKPIMKTLNPDWNAYFRFPAPSDPNEILIVRVYDNDNVLGFVSSTLLGRVNICIRDALHVGKISYQLVHPEVNDVFLVADIKSPVRPSSTLPRQSKMSSFDSIGSSPTTSPPATLSGSSSFSTSVSRSESMKRNLPVFFPPNEEEEEDLLEEEEEEIVPRVITSGTTVDVAIESPEKQTESTSLSSSPTKRQAYTV
eukprot:m.222015 g.222015  ORF g.222015 m.222015 type:complete len:1475 (+) comp33359_c0_seq6:351-4775(+)